MKVAIEIKFFLYIYYNFTFSPNFSKEKLWLVTLPASPDLILLVHDLPMSLTENQSGIKSFTGNVPRLINQHYSPDFHYINMYFSELNVSIISLDVFGVHVIHSNTSVYFNKQSLCYHF